MEVREVAVAAKRARGPVVAGDPLLVEVSRCPVTAATARSMSARRGAVDVEVVGARSLGDAERPRANAMRGVICDDRVARPLGGPGRGDESETPGSRPASRSLPRRATWSSRWRPLLPRRRARPGRPRRSSSRTRTGRARPAWRAGRPGRSCGRSDLSRDHFAVARDGVAGIGSDDVAAGAERTVSRGSSP